MLVTKSLSVYHGPACCSMTFSRCLRTPCELRCGSSSSRSGRSNRKELASHCRCARSYNARCEGSERIREVPWAAVQSTTLPSKSNSSLLRESTLQFPRLRSYGRHHAHNRQTEAMQGDRSRMKQPLSQLILVDYNGASRQGRGKSISIKLIIVMVALSWQPIIPLYRYCT